MVKLRSVAEIIAALGGYGAVGEITKSSYGAIWQWKYFNRLPHKHSRSINQALKKRGFGEVPPTLFGMKKSSAA